MADDPFDELAARGARARVMEEEKREEARRAREAAAESERSALLHDSLGTGNVPGAIAMGVFVVLALGGAERIAAATGALDYAVGVGLIVFGVVFALFLFGFLREHMLDRARRFLSSMPFEFDHEAYLRALSAKHMNASVTVRVRFAAEVPEAAQRTIEDAMVGAIGAGRAEMDDGVLVVSSPSLQGWFVTTSDTSSGSKHSNHLHHAWFRRLCAKGSSR